MLSQYYQSVNTEVNTSAPARPAERVPAGRPGSQVTERPAWSTGGLKFLWIGLAVADAGRLPGKVGAIRRPGRPSRAGQA
jgi:hypothetical protein